MTLQYTKASFAAVWALGILAVGLAANVTSASGQMALAAVAVLPPLVMWRVWTAPRESMSESIRKAIR
jgi:Cu/Ag efflux pump CusA